MEWQQLLGFYYVAKLGSFTRAAEATFRTQSALTQQIKNLEEDLDCRLIERLGKRKLHLTLAGEIVFKFAESLFQHYTELLEDLGEVKKLPKGRLRIAAPFTTLYHLLPGILKAYLSDFPHVEMTILDRSQQEVLRLLQEGEVDFGLALDSRIPASLTKERWLQVHTVLMTPAAHPLTRKKPVLLKDIAAHPLILPPRSREYSGRERLEELLRGEGLDYRVIMESSNVELSARYVELGMGISFATVVWNLPQTGFQKLKFISLDRYFKPDYISLVRRPGKSLSGYKQAFVDLLLAQELPVPGAPAP